MTADNEGVYIVSITTELLAQIVFEAAGVKSTTHTDHAVTRQAHSLQGQISHRIHRVRYNDDDSLGGVLKDLRSYALNDAGIHANQFLTRHTRLTGQTGRDNHYIRTGGSGIVIGYALNYG